jgi:hypothetical protein
MSVVFLRALVATLVLIWHLADHRFLLTADSRQVVTNHGVRTYDDTTCKIFSFGRIVFVETGRWKAKLNGKTIFDGENVAEGLILERRHERRTDKSVEKVADLWGKRMKTDIESYLRDPRAHPFEGLTGVFLASLADGSTYATVRELDPGKSGQVLIIPTPLTVNYFGVGERHAVELADTKFRDAGSYRVFSKSPAEFLFRVETDTINELKSPVVGGPVDELLLAPNRDAEWIHRKPSCQ